MIFKAPMDEHPSIRSFALFMKDSLKRFRVERISDQALVPTPENLQEEAVGFMLSEGWLRENKPLERIEVDPEGEVRVRVNESECANGETLPLARLEEGIKRVTISGAQSGENRFLSSLKRDPFSVASAVRF